MTENILSIDPSVSALGWSYSRNDTHLLSGVIKTNSKDSKEKRIEVIRSFISDFISENLINQIVIEDYGYGCKGRGVYTLGELGGVLRNLFYRNNIPVEVINITTIKKFITGKGICQKSLMLLHTYKKFGIEFEDDNECDAFCIEKCYWNSKKKEGDKI